jgi:hypothetical protein
MSAHTPGPWVVAPERCANWWGKHEAGTVVVGPDHDPICATNDDGIATTDDIANAILIAAAPDLLAACKEFADAVYDTATRKHCGGVMRDRLARLDAAIAKAEGADD